MAKHEESNFADGVKKMTGDELGAQLQTLRERLFTLRSRSVTEKVEDLSQFGVTKRNIARVMTEQSQRRIHGEGHARTPATHPHHAQPPGKKKVTRRLKKAAAKASGTHHAASQAGSHKKKKKKTTKHAHSHARTVRKKATKTVKAAPKRKAAKGKTK